MKAYYVSYIMDKHKVNIGHDLVYGNNITQATHNFFNNNSLLKAGQGNKDSSTVFFGRLKELDNTEQLPQKDIVEKLITKCNWHWTINGKQFTKANFKQKEFDKVFAI